MILFEKDLRGLVWHQNEASFYLDTSPSPNADMKEPWLIHDIQLEGPGDWMLVVQSRFGFENIPFELKILRKIVFLPGMSLTLCLRQTTKAPLIKLTIEGEVLSPERALQVYSAMVTDPAFRMYLGHLYTNSLSRKALTDLQTVAKAPSKREHR